MGAVALALFAIGAAIVGGAVALMAGAAWGEALFYAGLTMVAAEFAFLAFVARR